LVETKRLPILDSINFKKLKKMKKVILSMVALATFGFASAQEGQFKAGIHAGLPIGDAGDAFSFAGGADLAYMFSVSDKFKAGATTGYNYYSGKSIEVGFGFPSIKVNAAFIPIAASAQYSVADNFFLGADLGYALYAGDGESDGGIYYQPKAGYQTEKFELYLGYKGVSREGFTFSSIDLGFNYKF
jgi:hypothetical protein